MSIATSEAEKIMSSSLTTRLRAKDWGGLKDCLQSLGILRPLSPNEAVHFGIALANMGHTHRALQYLSVERLSEVRFRNLVHRHAIGPALQAGRVEVVVAFATRLVAAAPHDAGLVFALGKALVAVGHIDEGERRIDDAGALNPVDFEIASRRLTQHLRRGASEKAAAIARTLTTRQPLPARLALLCLTAFMRARDVLSARDVVDPLLDGGAVDLNLALVMARWLLQQSRPFDAVRLCERVLAEGAVSARLHLTAVDAHLAAGKPNEAAVHLDLAGTLAPDDLELAIRRIRTRLKQGQLSAAADIARGYVGQSVAHQRLAQVCLTALIRAGDTAAASQMAHQIAERGTDHAETAVLAVRALLDASCPEDAVSLAETTLKQCGSSGRLHLAAAKAMFAAGRPFDQILPHVEAAREEGRDDPAVLHALGKVSLGLGRYDDAISTLQKAVAMGSRGGNIFLMAKALKHARRYQEAADVMMSGADALGATRNWRRQTTAALSLAGRADQAESIYRALVDERRSKLADTFAAHLLEIDGQPGPEAIPQARLDWAWTKVETSGGCPPSRDRSDWDRRARWGFKADRAILDWVECRPHAIEEVVSTLGDCLGPTNKLHDLLAKGRGLFIAGAHIGLMYAGPVVLQAADVPFKVVAQMPRVSTATYGQHLISTFDQSRTAVVRQIVGALDRNQAVTITVDATMNPAAIRVEWEGVGITYTDFVATVSFRRGTPSVFAQPYWKNGAIEFVVVPLPVAHADESEPAFLLRWRKAYLDELLHFLQRGPENLRLAEGLWRSIPA